MLNIQFVQSKFSKKNRHVAKILGLLTPLLNVWFICFQSEVTRLQEQIDTEVRVRKDLDEKVAKMNQLLTTGQEALQQEKKTVEMLRQQIVSQTPTKVSF